MLLLTMLLLSKARRAALSVSKSFRLSPKVSCIVSKLRAVGSLRTPRKVKRRQRSEGARTFPPATNQVCCLEFSDARVKFEKRNSSCSIRFGKEAAESAERTKTTMMIKLIWQRKGTQDFRLRNQSRTGSSQSAESRRITLLVTRA